MSGYLQGKDGGPPEAPPVRKPVTAPALAAMRAAGTRITMLTCYDASFAALMDRCDVTVAEIAYHTAAVARGNKRALVLADMPFGSYTTKEAAHDNAVTLMRAGAQMVKIEGGGWLAETVRFLTERGIPVCAHLGLTPQFVHQFGGYKVQGKTIESADQLKRDCKALQDAGASIILIEAVPAGLAKEVTESLHVPTIGIGAGPDCSGQVLVMHDLLGVFPGRKARFVKNFMDGQTSIDAAVHAYVAAVRDGSFPGPEHCF
jgi:3-methyl-2-oxobutanoate hydroxymethyltransferase